MVTISYNQAQFLDDAITSVHVQKPNSVEYVIVDAGSQDSSREIISSRREKFEAAILESDAGPAEGLNKGFNCLKRADVCGYLNADDRLTGGALDYVCQFFEAHPRIDVLLGSIYIIDSQGSRKFKSRHVGRVSLQAYAERRCAVWQQATFFRRSCFEAVRGFNVNNRTCWDAELIVDLMLAGFQIGYTHRVLGEFRIHQSSITGSGSQNLRHQAAYHLDHARINQKIYAAGFPKRSSVVSRTSQFLHRLSPYRHVANLIVGAYGIIGQRITTDDEVQE